MMDDIEQAMWRAAVGVICKQAAKKAGEAKDGTVEHDKFPGVFVRSAEAALGDRRAGELTALADALEAAP